ncbi:MAG: hypothetical protein M1826_000541 [Phylliscum demangeonii]|nr:MAG: hypothetical protein M1826_000541 [Phylliscum demangeonii]
MCFLFYAMFSCRHIEDHTLCRYSANPASYKCGGHPRTADGRSLGPVHVRLTRMPCLQCTLARLDEEHTRQAAETVLAKKMAGQILESSNSPAAHENWTRCMSNWIIVTTKQARDRRAYEREYDATMKETALPKVKAEVEGKLAEAKAEMDLKKPDVDRRK